MILLVWYGIAVTLVLLVLFSAWTLIWGRSLWKYKDAVSGIAFTVALALFIKEVFMFFVLFFAINTLGEPNVDMVFLMRFAERTASLILFIAAQGLAYQIKYGKGPEDE